MTHAPTRPNDAARERDSHVRALVAAVAIAAVAVWILPSRSDRAEPSGPSSASGAFNGSPDAVLSAEARGVETDARVVGITSLSVGEGSSISISGHLQGEQPGTRTFSVEERDFTLEGRDIALNVRTLVRRGDVRIEESVPTSNVTVSGRVTLVASEITSWRAGATKPQTHRGSVSFTADLEGTLRIGSRVGAAGVQTVRWTDAPKTIRVRDAERSMTSWAGSGTVRTDGRRFTNEFGALAARSLTATIERTPDGVTVSGRGRMQQVYLDGEPQFWTEASCDAIQLREETAAGRSLELTWAPRNMGDFDMVMRRIVPIGPAAGWLSFGLEGKPNEFGGETRPDQRGDTLGFREGLAIRSVLPPGDADRRDIGVGVPHGTAPGTYDATVRIEGNFDAVLVPFEVIVVGESELSR